MALAYRAVAWRRLLEDRFEASYHVIYRGAPVRVFVTGADTGVGKTWVSAWLTRSWNAGYWKPVHSGTVEGWDADLVKRVAPDAAIFPSRHAFPDPLSPDQAAERPGVRIDLHDFSLPEHDGPLVVEGAGGILVPLNDLTLMADLMERLGLPLVLVARSGLGTINHSLLSIAESRRRLLPLAGIVLVGSGHPTAVTPSSISAASRSSPSCRRWPIPPRSGDPDDERSAGVAADLLELLHGVPRGWNFGTLFAEVLALTFPFPFCAPAWAVRATPARPSPAMRRGAT
jgi:dethiobiotin synthetase